MDGVRDASEYKTNITILNLQYVKTELSDEVNFLHMGAHP